MFLLVCSHGPCVCSHLHATSATASLVINLEIKGISYPVRAFFLESQLVPEISIPSDSKPNGLEDGEIILSNSDCKDFTANEKSPLLPVPCCDFVPSSRTEHRNSASRRDSDSPRIESPH